MKILIVPLLLVISVVALIWWQQERILFQPPGHPDIGDVSATRIEFTAADGQKLFAFLVGDPERKTVLLAFHGNADLAVWQLDWATEIVRRFGVAVLLVEYRGYSGLSGRPTYATSALDSEAAYQAAIQKLAVPPEGILLFGHSLGSAIATELAIRHPVRALILQSPFTSAREMATLTFARPLTLIWDMISRIHFDVGRAVQSLDARVSVIHGTRDMVIPARMGRAVYEAAKVKGAFTLVENAGHNNVVDVAGENYWKWFAEALRFPTAG